MMLYSATGEENAILSIFKLNIVEATQGTPVRTPLGLQEKRVLGPGCYKTSGFRASSGGGSVGEGVRGRR